jgi:hypothetical protein
MQGRSLTRGESGAYQNHPTNFRSNDAHGMKRAPDDICHTTFLTSESRPEGYNVVCLFLLWMTAIALIVKACMEYF